MSADDQRAAERLRLAVDVWWPAPPEQIRVRTADVAELLAELEGVRAEWAETRSADVDVIVGLRAELAETRLRAERAEFRRDAQTNLSMALRDEGDLLAAVVESYNVNDDVRWADVLDAIGSWRSVRGDAPTAGGLLPDKRILIDLTPPSRAIPADQRRKLAAELRSRFVDGPVDEWSAGWLSAAGYIGSDSPIGTDAGTDLAAPAVAPTEPPAVGLPVTLSSPDDVGTVCAHLGMSQVRERTWYCNSQVAVWAAGTGDEGTGGVEIDSVPLHLDVQFPAATSLVVAAIEAARGGSR